MSAPPAVMQTEAGKIDAAALNRYFQALGNHFEAAPDKEIDTTSPRAIAMKNHRNDYKNRFNLLQTTVSAKKTVLADNEMATLTLDKLDFSVNEYVGLVYTLKNKTNQPIAADHFITSINGITFASPEKISAGANETKTVTKLVNRRSLSYAGINEISQINLAFDIIGPKTCHVSNAQVNTNAENPASYHLQDEIFVFKEHENVRASVVHFTVTEKNDPVVVMKIENKSDKPIIMGASTSLINGKKYKSNALELRIAPGNIGLLDIMFDGDEIMKDQKTCRTANPGYPNLFNTLLTLNLKTNGIGIPFSYGYVYFRIGDDLKLTDKTKEYNTGEIHSGEVYFGTQWQDFYKESEVPEFFKG